MVKYGKPLYIDTVLGKQLFSNKMSELLLNEARDAKYSNVFNILAVDPFITLTLEDGIYNIRVKTDDEIITMHVSSVIMSLHVSLLTTTYNSVVYPQVDELLKWLDIALEKYYNRGRRM